MSETMFLYRSRKDGGWGVQPNDLTLTVTPGVGKATIGWTGKRKTVIDGQTVSEIYRVAVVRNEDHVPENENDGTTIFVSGNNTASYEDTGLTNGKTYYYNVFPYSKHNVYNRNCEGASVTPSEGAVVTITFNCNNPIGSTLTAKKGTETVSAEIKQLAVGSGAYATLSLTSTGDWDISGVKVNISELGQSKSVKGHVYGYNWLLPPAEADTESQITYPDDVDNASFNGVPDVTSTDKALDLGDWNEFFTDFINARPVMLNFDGTVATELDHSDQTKNMDGTASNVANASVNQNAMVEVPKKYLKRNASDGYGHFWISEFKLSDNYSADPWLWGDDRETATEMDVIYMPMFKGSAVSGKLRSIAGQTPINTQTGATERSYAQAMGDGWDIDDYGDFMLISDLMLMAGKSTDVQRHWGYGHYDGGSSASSLHATGSLKAVGPFYGGTNNTNMKFLWLENWYGDRWDRTLGCYLVNGVIYVKSFGPYTVDGTVTNYTNLGHGIGGTNGGYISEVTYGKDGWAAKTASGATGKYLPDGAWFATGTNVLLRGGSCGNGLQCGLTYDLYDPGSNSGWSLGASPTFKKASAA